MPTSAFRKVEDLPKVLAVFPLDGAVLFPGGHLPLRIFEPRYLNMLDDAMASERMFGMIQTVPGGDRSHPALVRVGCLGRVTSYSETSDDQYLITLTGVCRFEVEAELAAITPYRQVRASYLPFEADLHPAPEEPTLDRTRLLKSLRRYLERRAIQVDWDAARNAPGEALVNSLSGALPFDPREKQALLEAPTLADRARALVALLEIEAASGDDDEDPPIQ